MGDWSTRTPGRVARLAIYVSVDYPPVEQTRPPLRAVREARGLGLRGVAESAGIDPAHLSRVERGQASLSVEALHRLAGVLELRELQRLLGPYLRGVPLISESPGGQPGLSSNQARRGQNADQG